MAGAAAVARVRDVLAPVVQRRGYDLEELTLAPAGARRVLRVIVDRDGGVDLDDVAELSREASAALDAQDVLGAAPYVLEVSSPGVDRPLVSPRHWRRAVGRLVHATLTDGGALTGRIRSADDDGVLLACADGERTLPYAQLRRGRVQVEFHREEGDA